MLQTEARLCNRVTCSQFEGSRGLSLELNVEASHAEVIGPLRYLADCWGFEGVADVGEHCGLRGQEHAHSNERAGRKTPTLARSVC